MHLCAAANLVPLLQEENGLNPKDNTAIEFLLGAFISFDIISCASTRSSPFLTLDHEAILEKHEINLQNIIGCENWVMILILEISKLDKWKKDTEKSHKLSVLELVKRGSQIENILRKNLDKIDYILPDKFKEDPRSKITEIFALSALTYLYVVISGPHPELKEIKENVGKTITAFNNLNDVRLLRNLVWPFCISGCLALDEQQTFFRQLISKADVTSMTLGTCMEAFKVVEECWMERKTCSCSFDWVSAMNKRGFWVLLW